MKTTKKSMKTLEKSMKQSEKLMKTNEKSMKTTEKWMKTIEESMKTNEKFMTYENHWEIEKNIEKNHGKLKFPMETLIQWTQTNEIGTKMW